MPRTPRSTARRSSRTLAAVAGLAIVASGLSIAPSFTPWSPVSALASEAPPVALGDVAVVLGAGSVATSFEVTTPRPTTLDSVRLAVRPASDPDSSDGRLDVEASKAVVVDGTRRFTASTGSLAPGGYVAWAAVLLEGRWVQGALAAPFTVPDAVRAPAPGSPTQPSSPVVGDTVGEAAGFSPGGGFPYLSEDRLAVELDALVASGARWVRVDFPWTTVERVRGTYDWSFLDRVTAAAAQRGVKVLALPAYTPSWARPAGCTSDKCGPTDPHAFAQFVAAAATRYGPDRVQAWEIWNEPNIPHFWAPKPDMDAYARLLSETARALREVRPDTTIVSGGMSPAYSDGTSVSPVDAVKRLYELGAMEDVDAAGIHPYSDKHLPLSPGTDSWNTFLQMKTVYDVMSGYGDDHKQVWGTEFGVATGTSSKSTTEQQQAAMIAQGFGRLGDGTWPWLGTLFAYSLRDSRDAPADWQSNFGLRRWDGSPKPAWHSFTAAMDDPLVR